MKSFSDTCIAKLPGMGWLADWTEALSIGATVEVNILGRVQALEIGIAFEFTDDGYHVGKTKCFVGGSSGLTTNKKSLDSDVGIEVVAWRHKEDSPGNRAFDQVPGYSAELGFTIDACKVRPPPSRTR